MAAIPPVGGLAETAASDLVIVRESDVITEDLYAAGERVIVRGVIEGDLIAAAFNDVRIEGVVQGDVLAVAGDVIVDGDVEGSVRAVGRSVRISGTVGDDAAVAAWDTHLAGAVARDLLAFGWRLSIPGSIGREARATMFGDVTIAGDVGADAELNARRTTLRGTVGGDFRYRGEAVIAPAARVDGLTGEFGALPVPLRVRALLLGSVVLAALTLLGVGAMIWWTIPRLVERAIASTGQPWRSLGVGIVATILPPILMAAVIAGFGSVSADLSVPALLIIVPLGVAYLGVVLVGSVAGFVPAAFIAGRVVPGVEDPRFRYLVGAVVMATIAAVHPVGALVAAVLLVTGLGAMLRALRAA